MSLSSYQGVFQCNVAVISVTFKRPFVSCRGLALSTVKSFIPRNDVFNTLPIQCGLTANVNLKVSKEHHNLSVGFCYHCLSCKNWCVCECVCACVCASTWTVCLSPPLGTGQGRAGGVSIPPWDFTQMSTQPLLCQIEIMLSLDCISLLKSPSGWPSKRKKTTTKCTNTKKRNKKTKQCYTFPCSSSLLDVLPCCEHCKLFWTPRRLFNILWYSQPFNVYCKLTVWK